MPLIAGAPRFNFRYLERIYLVDTAVGSGKTTAVIDYMLEPENIHRNFIYVAPSTNLCNQTCNKIEKAIIGKELASRPVITIHFKNAINTTGRVLQSIKDAEPDSGTIHIITTTTFINTLYHLENKNHHSVILDEAFEPTSYIPFKSSGNLKLCTDLFTEDAHGRVLPKDKDSVRKIAVKDFDEDLNEYNNPDIIEMCKSVSNQAIRCEYVEKEDNKVVLATYISPEHMYLFQEVIFLSALFKNTILHMLWTNKFNVNFKEHTYFKGKQEAGDIRNTHIEQGKLIHIWHILDANNNASGYNLKRNYTTGFENEAEHGKRVIDYIVDTANEHFDSEDYLLVLNKEFKEVAERYNKATVIGTKEHGSNKHIKQINVAVLASTNAYKDHAKWLADTLDISVQELYNVSNFETAYQAFGRCAIRNRENTTDIQLIVLSHRMAELLQETFPASTLVGQLGDLPNLVALKAENSDAVMGRPKQAKPLRENLEYLADTKAIRRYENMEQLTPKQQRMLNERKQNAEAIKQQQVSNVNEKKYKML